MSSVMIWNRKVQTGNKIQLPSNFCASLGIKQGTKVEISLSKDMK